MAVNRPSPRSVYYSHKSLTIPLLQLLENVEHCGDEPEQAVTMPAHMNRLSFMLK